MEKIKSTVCQTYRVPEIARILDIADKTAYNFCNANPPFKVYTIGKSIRINKASFDNWFASNTQ